jgi:hypothetical protein
MTEPFFKDGPPVPMMVEGNLDDPSIERYLQELTTQAELIAIRAKGASMDYSMGLSAELSSTLQQLRDGSLRSVQINYLFSDDHWTDTLFQSPQGLRVVRCRHEK